MLSAVLSELEVEKYLIAREITAHNPSVSQMIQEQLGGKAQEWVSYEEFKVLTRGSKAVIRTGEATPCANVILQSGVKF